MVPLVSWRPVSIGIQLSLPLETLILRLVRAFSIVQRTDTRRVTGWSTGDMKLSQRWFVYFATPIFDTESLKLSINLIQNNQVYLTRMKKKLILKYIEWEVGV